MRTSGRRHWYRAQVGCAQRLTRTGGQIQIQAGTNNYLIFPAEFGQFQTVGFRPITDNNRDIGNASFRYREIFAANDVINTSDVGDKIVRGAMTDAEKRVAARLRSLITCFRWKDAVAAKGDGARLHFGLTAQDVIAAFEAEGLDPFVYAPVCADELFEDVEEEYTEVAANEIEIEREVSKPVVVGDHVVMRKVREAVTEVETRRLPVRDEATGEIVMEEDVRSEPRAWQDENGIWHGRHFSCRRPVMVDMPVMREVTKTRKVLKPSGRTRLGLRYNELMAFIMGAEQ